MSLLLFFLLLITPTFSSTPSKPRLYFLMHWKVFNLYRRVLVSTALMAKVRSNSIQVQLPQFKDLLSKLDCSTNDHLNVHWSQGEGNPDGSGSRVGGS